MDDGRRHGGWRWALVALAAAWIATVLALQLAGRTPAELASSPDWLADGRVLRLLSSSLVIDDDLPLLQLALLGAVTVVVMVRQGAVVWWVAALLGHVGSALIAYAAIGVAIALDVDSAERSADDLDYGISCVLAAELGVLALDSARRLRRGEGGRLDWLLLATAAAMVVVWLATLDWFGIEHQFAFLLGIAALLACERIARRRAARERTA